MARDPITFYTPIPGVPGPGIPRTGTPPRNDLQFGAPASSEITSQTAPTAVPATTPQFSGRFSNENIQKFNLALTGLLTKAQGLGSKGLREQSGRLQAERSAAVQEFGAGADPSLGLSPSQQARIRQAKVSGISGSLAEVGAQLQEREAAINRLPGTLSALSQFASQFAENVGDDAKYVTLGKNIVEIKDGKAEVILSIDEGANPETVRKQLSDTLSIRKDYQNQSKSFVVVRDSYSRMLAVTDDPSAAGDLALIFSFMKVLDPGSTVRETEFANAENAASVPVRIQNMWNRALKGERVAFNRQDFLDQAKNLYESQLGLQNELLKSTRDFASDFDLDPEKAAPDLSLGVFGQTSADDDPLGIR